MKIYTAVTEASNFSLKRGMMLLEKRIIDDIDKTERIVDTWEHTFEDDFKIVINLRAGKKEYFMEGFLYNEEGEIENYTRFSTAVTPVSVYNFNHKDTHYTLCILGK